MRRSAPLLTLLAFATVLSSCASSASVFDDSAADSFSVANDHYRVMFRKSDGAIAEITDAATGQMLARGARDGCLWRASDQASSCAFRAGSADAFTYSWSEASQTLTMDYTPSAGKPAAVKARVIVVVHDDAFLDFAIEIESSSATPIDDIAFPGGIALRDADVKRALLPLIPGLVLRPGFFDASRSYVAKYPGEGMFADFVAFETTVGSLALYEISDGTLHPAWLGIAHEGESVAGEAVIRHSFAPRLANGRRWASPRMRLRIGAGLVGSVLAWRNDNGIAAITPLETRAGVLLPRLVRAPFLKLDMQEMRRAFVEFEPVIRALAVPSVLHFTGYGIRGFDEDYPDFLPPNPAHGTTEEFATLVASAKGLGHITIPYTNPTWWDDEGPTLGSLPSPLTIPAIAVIDDGAPRWETYGVRGGYAVSPWHPFVTKRVDEAVTEVIESLGCDMLFEDQIGARPWLFDANPAAPSPTSYIDGWVDHARRHASAMLGTESGFDRLLGYELAFFGCITPDGDGWATERFGEGNWEIFPFVALAARDKALFYFHNMGANPVTTANLTMSLATGQFPVFPLYNPPGSIFNTGRGGGLDRDDLRVVSLLQRYVLSRYATERPTAFTWVTPHVTKTRFPSVEIVANGDDTPLDMPEGSVVPGGAIARALDGSMVAGLFTTWSGVRLANGEHWIIEERDAQGVTIRKPSGADTAIVIRPLAGWSASTQLEVRAIDARGELVRTLPFSWTTYGPLFAAARWIDGREITEWRVVDPTKSPRRRGARAGVPN
ncbi:MAG: hypothetical protein HYU52_14770 [Acidobacteria bacterium]|nr:hypothetical protein [Acidobacteriota bacterium]